MDVLHKPRVQQLCPASDDLKKHPTVIKLDLQLRRLLPHFKSCDDTFENCFCMLLIGKQFLSILKHNQRTPITRSAKIMGQKPTKLKRSDSCICGQFANHDCSCVFVCHCATESSLVPSLLVSQAPMTPHFSPLEIFTSTQVRHLGRRLFMPTTTSTIAN